ncbi:MAG TPA: molybdopterin cofactor-binding domain-containing protein [Vicinamibacterales bacterium]|nr:molybdopterin cofactor-binding domain-containing protein [Vicinamibacterales bacterium]
MRSRREFLQTSGMLVASVAAISVEGVEAFLQRAPSAAGPYPDVDFLKLDSWIVIRPDNTATFFVGKTDLGQGTGTAFRQIMSDELDIAFENTTCVMGSTDITVDQGGSGGSDALQTDGYPMRRVAAEARRVLLDLASDYFGVPSTSLSVSDGVVSTRQGDTAERSITYGQLIGGKTFNVTLSGRNIDATTGRAPLKAVQAMKNVGKSPRRDDIPAKVNGTQRWAVDMKVPGMLHARNVRPPMVGATLKAIDESSVKDVPGLVKVVSRGNYIAVVCEREEQAIRAARQLKVEWTPPASAPFPSSENLFTYMRATPPSSASDPVVAGDVNGAIASAANVVEARYDVPFQGHTAFGPAHALADPSNGQLTIYSNDMKSYGMRTGIAQFLKIPKENIRVVWMQGPQAYGRTAAEDAGFEAAFLATELGKPVRMQWTRQEETGWDTKGPAYAVTMRGALDARGQLVALDYDARAADFNHVGYNEAETVLIAQLMGQRKAQPARGRASFPSDKYSVPNRRMAGSVVPMPLAWETPIRMGNLRDPDGPQVTFASESFIDELAFAAKADPVAFRLALLERDKTDDAGFKRVRSIACLKAVAEKFGWDPRPSPLALGAVEGRARTTGDIAVGRGVAYAFRSETVVAEMVEVEVNRRTGRVWVKRIACAHDCGLVINPEALTHTIEGGLLHSVSRALFEEARFDESKMLSVDWVTSPTLTHADVPERIDVVLVNGDPDPNRPDLKHYGAGETMCKPMLAAVANAVFDATGIRMRRVPFTPARVLAALKS